MRQRYAEGLRDFDSVSRLVETWPFSILDTVPRELPACAATSAIVRLSLSLSCRNGVHRSAADDYEKLGTAPGFCHHCHTGRCPVGVTTQDAILEKRLEPYVGAKRVRNYLKTLNMELTTIVRACGKQSAHHLEREDLVALTVEAAAMARLPLAWTSWIPGNFLSGNTLLREKRGLKMRLLQSRACNLLTH